MIIIAAMSKNRVIGSGDGMPWSVPDEYQQYLRFVTGNCVIMGRRTHEIFGDDLPESTSVVVVTRRPKIEGASVVTSFDDAVEIAKQWDKTVFVAGGGSIYQQAIPVADEMYLSTIKGEFDGDTYFPEFDSANWSITEERDESQFVFRKYRRR